MERILLKFWHYPSNYFLLSIYPSLQPSILVIHLASFYFLLKMNGSSQKLIRVIITTMVTRYSILRMNRTLYNWFTIVVYCNGHLLVVYHVSSFPSSLVFIEETTSSSCSHGAMGNLTVALISGAPAHSILGVKDLCGCLVAQLAGPIKPISLPHSGLECWNRCFLFLYRDKNTASPRKGWQIILQQYGEPSLKRPT